MKNVIPELELYCQFLAPLFKARATGDKEANLTCRQGLLMVLEAFTRADRAHSGAELDAAADAFEAMTGARELLEEELFPLLDPPKEEPAAAAQEPAVEPPAPPADVPHAPGTNGAAAAYVADAMAKAQAQRAPNG